MKPLQKLVPVLAFAAAAAVAGVAHEAHAGPWSAWAPFGQQTTCTDSNPQWGPGHSAINGNNKSQAIIWCDNYECGPGGQAVVGACDAANNCEAMDTLGGSAGTSTGGGELVKHHCEVFGVLGATW
jgi:hypothetical protein